MPGLVGIISLDWREIVDLSQQKKMVQAIFHRKWYKQMDVIPQEGNYAISRIHHGIMNDLEKPVGNQEARVSVIIEGEIYNDIPVGISESEYILGLYLKKGENFSAELNGSFVVIVVDKKKKKIVISNDRTASRPLYWYNDGRYLYFSPEIKAFLTIPTFNKKINEAAIASFLSSGYLINGLTYFNDIYCLDNASLIIITNNNVNVKKYWDFQFIENPPDRGIDYYAHKTGELVQQSVKRRLKSNDNLGIMLSGGMDSRSILGAYYELMPLSPPVTITWGIREEMPESDGVRARELSRIVNSAHTFINLVPEKITEYFRQIVYFNEALTDTAGNYPEALNTFIRIREDLGVDVLLRGDQCFSGGDYIYKEEDILPKHAIYSFPSIPVLQSILNRDKYDALNKTNNQSIREVIKRCSSINLINRKDFFYLDQRLVSYLNPLSYLKQIEVEIKNPLIDNDLLDFIFRVPQKYRINKKFFHEATRKSFPSLKNVPIALKENDINWGNIIKEDEIIQRFIRSVLLSENNSFDEYINKKELELFLDEYFSQILISDEDKIWPFSRQIKSKIKRFKPIVLLVRKFRNSWIIRPDTIIFRLLTLKIWFYLFVDNVPFKKPNK